MNLAIDHNKCSSVKTFKETFCERFKCSAEEYRNEVLFQCMHPQSRCLLNLVLWFGTPMTQDAITLVEEVGQTASVNDARELVAEYRNRARRSRRFLKIRFSSEKLLRLYSTVMTPK
jgi:hypothetical protein